MFPNDVQIISAFCRMTLKSDIQSYYYYYCFFKLVSYKSHSGNESPEYRLQHNSADAADALTATVHMAETTHP